MIIDWGKSGPWQATPVRIYRVSDDEEFTALPDITELNTITGEYTSIPLGFGSLHGPVYVVTSDGERITETGDPRPTEEAMPDTEKVKANLLYETTMRLIVAHISHGGEDTDLGKFITLAQAVLQRTGMQTPNPNEEE